MHVTSLLIDALFVFVLFIFIFLQLLELIVEGQVKNLSDKNMSVTLG
jgi:hypothetical protein